MIPKKRKAKRFQPRPQREKKPVRSSQQGFGREMPPDYILVEIYFDQKEAPAQAAPFFSWYESINWTGPRGAAYKNWKVLASDWIFNYHQVSNDKSGLSLIIYNSSNL